MNRRRFLTAKEVQAMMQAARQGPTGERDYCLILLAFRHGMRISELLDLHYHDLDLHEGRVNVRRLKNGFSTIHPLRFDEREAIERWSLVRAGWKAADKTDALFISRRGTALSRQQAYRIIRSAGENAGTVTHTHPHMLRHACGYCDARDNPVSSGYRSPYSPTQSHRSAAACAGGSPVAALPVPLRTR